MDREAAVREARRRAVDSARAPVRFVVSRRKAVGLVAGAWLLGSAVRRGHVSRGFDASLDAQWQLAHPPHPMTAAVRLLRSWGGRGELIGLIAIGAVLEGRERMPLARLRR